MNWSWPWDGLLRDLVEIRGSELQLAQYVAVISGIRRSLDDWVPGANLDDFRRMTARWGLVVAVDCVFKPLAETDHVVVADMVPTTRAVGLPYSPENVDTPGSVVHVIVSSRADWAAETLAAGWYPIAVEGRVLHKPQVDHVRLGRAFGYPNCCVEFFLHHNDWPRQNTPAEASRASTRIHWECNCLTKRTPWMALFHMPCAYDCPATRAYTTAVLGSLEAFDSGYAQRIRTTLQQPFLVISEILCYALVGGRTLDSGRTEYSRALFAAGDNYPDRYGRALSEGNALAVCDGLIYVWKNDILLHALEPRCDRGVMEIPLVIPFQCN